MRKIFTGKNLLVRTILTSFTIFMFLTACNKSQQETVISEKYKIQEHYEPIIDSLIARMTLDEKVGMLHGTGMFVSGGVERLGIPEFHYTDGPNGVREELERHSWNPLGLGNDSATFFPTGSALGATWNTELAYRYGEGLGLETRARGKDMILGPAVNIMRTPIGGRTFEYFTEDPLLNSRITVAYVKGVQNQDVAVCVKHFAANNQEFERMSVSIEMDERTLQEIYLPAYKASVLEANALGMMGAYNQFRGEYLCQHDYLNNQILKGEWGFKGMIVSDWGATHNTVTAALGGLDVEMGTDTHQQNYDLNFMGHPLRDSVLAGSIPMEVIDDKVRRILRVTYNLNKMEEGREEGEFVSDKIKQIARDVAAESIVLLKNDQKLLPLDADKLKSMAVIGLNATQSQAKGGFTAGVKPKYEISPLQGLQNKVGDQITIHYAKGYVQRFEQEHNWRTPAINTPDSALLAEAVEAARNAEVAIIFAGNTREIETETIDRASLDLPFGQDELIRAVTAVNPNTIVVIIAGAPVNLNTARETASAIVYGWFNGSEGGNAMADVLFGDVNPSGKLPFTIPVQLSDVGVHALDAYPGKDLIMEYKEGILVGYRWFDTKKIEPAYPFGFGMSYSDFNISKVKTNKSTYRKDEQVQISITIENTGNFDGKEVIQCYVNDEDSSVLRPEKELKTFAKVFLKAGEKKTVSLNLDVEDLAFFDENSKQWVLEPGFFKLMLGNSSRNIYNEKKIEIIN
ncbi:MAG: glycoside hydrolase family 3 C-terminal domain-containing protein [Prolixibacteraceae bacterium]|nr:glycoside hydrolase family 3 C-terminal domain-containing protein [Prolixibacteraceae bacterium]